MDCILTRMHEDMLSYRGECVTCWEIQVFQMNCVILELGQPDLINVL